MTMTVSLLPLVCGSLKGVSLQLFVEAWQSDLPPLQKFTMVALSELCSSDGELDHWDANIARLVQMTGLSASERPCAPLGDAREPRL